MDKRMENKLHERRTGSQHEPANRTAVVTGATSGIGFAALQEMLARGWCCIAIGRSEERIREADRKIRLGMPHVQVQWLMADLSSLEQVNRLVREVQGLLETGDARAAHVPLDALVLCAGLVTQWYQATEDGYEMQFAVNHLSQMRLALGLRPWLEASAHARLLTVSSGSHYGTRIRWQDVMLRRHYNPLQAYKQSKLCNVLFAAEWNRRHKDSATAYAVDPGLVDTDIGCKGTNGLVHLVWRWRRRSGTSPDVPARTIVHLLEALDPKTAGHLYWKDVRPQEESRIASDPAEAARLWEYSIRLM